MSNMEKRNFLNEYRRRSFILGKRIAVSKFNSERMATAIGISDNAGLIVRYDDGNEGNPSFRRSKNYKAKVKMLIKHTCF